MAVCLVLCIFAFLLITTLEPLTLKSGEATKMINKAELSAVVQDASNFIIIQLATFCAMSQVCV